MLTARVPRPRPLGGLGLDDWVEFVDDRYTRSGAPEPLQQVKRIDPLDLTVHLAAAPATTTGHDDALHPYLRRWDQRAPLPGSGGPALASDNALKVTESDTDWIDLEDGIQIQFKPGGTYAPGDYWLVPARTETGDIEWPRANGQPLEQPPTGVTWHQAPLALVTGPGSVLDLRCVFNRLGCP